MKVFDGIVDEKLTVLLICEQNLSFRKTKRHPSVLKFTVFCSCVVVSIVDLRAAFSRKRKVLQKCLMREWTLALCLLRFGLQHLCILPVRAIRYCKKLCLLFSLKPFLSVTLQEKYSCSTA